MQVAETGLIANLAASMRTPRLRTLSEFAEAEIVLPDGPFAGRRFRLNRHPIARLLFGELDSGRWQRAFITGPNQDGKSLLGFVIPTMYLLFERQETVILGVPSLDLVADKWTVDLLPVLRASRYAKLLPQTGKGSRDGESILFEFANGAFLRFMTAGGGDQSRAGFTSPNLVVTETDGFDVVGGASREGSKFDQLERRTLAYADRARTIAECTVSVEQGRTWQEYLRGTHSRVALRCPHCLAWVTPEREHFAGWQEAETEIQAIAGSCVACPECGAAWTNEQRVAANHDARLVHKGQTVAADGVVSGPVPETNTLGFRWSVVNSVLNPKRLSMVAGIEWRARRSADEDAAERDVCQSQWALPAKPAKVDLTQLDAFALMRRTLPKFTRGFCPDGVQCVTVACDVGKRLCHWAAIAWGQHATPHVIDYGRLEVPSDQMSEEDAIMLALRDWRDEVVSLGWKHGDATVRPAIIFVDAGNWQQTVQAFCAQSGQHFFATKGYGIGQKRDGKYKRDTGAKVIGIGDNYALIELVDGTRLMEVNADRWKSFLHARWHTPIGQPGAMTLFEKGEHLSFCKHQVAERLVEEFVPKEGTVQRWEAVNRNNHYLDATTLACVAGHAAGMRLIEQPAPEQPRPVQSEPSVPFGGAKRW
jgi:phage terminase large subunit GpA-like protein